LFLAVLGPLLQSRFKLSSHRLETSPELQASLKEMEDLANTQPVTDWEMKLVGVVKDFATGYVHFSWSFQKVNPLPPSGNTLTILRNKFFSLAPLAGGLKFPPCRRVDVFWNNYPISKL
jgi:hypothetical protein